MQPKAVPLPVLIRTEILGVLNVRSSIWAIGLATFCAIAASLAISLSPLAMLLSNEGSELYPTIMAMASLPISIAVSVISVSAVCGMWQHGSAVSLLPLYRSREQHYWVRCVALILVSAAMGALAFGLANVAYFTGRLFGRFPAESIPGGEVAHSLGILLSSCLLGSILGQGIAAIIRRPLVSLCAIVGLHITTIAATSLSSLPVVLKSGFSTLTPFEFFDAPRADATFLAGVALSFALWYVLPLFAGALIQRKASF